MAQLCFVGSVPSVNGTSLREERADLLAGVLPACIHAGGPG